MKKYKHGISLIILVITIAIIIILTAAVLLRVRDENITKKAMEVVNKNNIVVLKEEWNNYLAKLKTDYAAEHKKSLKISEINFDEEKSEDVNKLKEALPTLEKLELQNDFRVVNGNLIYVGTDSSIESIIKEVGTISTSEVLYTTKKDESKWNKPYVPAGYSVVVENGKALNNIDKGFVIKCDVGTYSKDSEFVWVPVKSEEEYTRYTEAFNKMSDSDTVYTDTVGYSQKNSIVKYGGFYIGRYESSATTYSFKNTWDFYYPASVKNKEVMISKPYFNYGLGDIIARMSGTSEDSTKNNVQYPNLKLSLITGYMWDITCKWLYDCNEIINNNLNYFYGPNSSTLLDNIGYFTVGDYQTTGSSDTYKLNNIYDFSGNTEEITTEMSGSQYVIRGGGCNTNNHKLPLLNRGSIAGNTNAYGFRLALYIE